MGGMVPLCAIGIPRGHLALPAPQSTVRDFGHHGAMGSWGACMVLLPTTLLVGILARPPPS